MRLHKYIIAIVNNLGHKTLAINTMPDHLHMLIGMRPYQSLSDLMQMVKGDSSKWINEQRLTKGKFNWQEGYAAFSYAKKECNTVIKYIANQENHHRKKNFLEEYRMILNEFEIDYNERFIFNDPE